MMHLSTDHPDRLKMKGINHMATITPKEFAQKLGTDPRTVRKFLRSEAGMNSRVGKGSRWALESKQIASLTKKFRKWDEARKTTDEVDAPEVPTED